MKKLLLSIFILLSLSSIAKCEMKEFPIFDFSGGLYTNDQPERIGDNYTPDCLNVWLDRETGVVKRPGYASFLQTALPEGQPIRSMFEFRKNDGTRYIIFNSSSSIYYSKNDGIAVNVLQGQNSANVFNFTTALDTCLFDNGITTGFFNGSTVTLYGVTNSTSMITGKYNVYYKDHWFKAGVTSNLSGLYWSVVNQPGDFGSYGSGAKFVGKDDGDVITGLYPMADRLLIFKRYSTWQLVGTDAATWLVRPVSSNIGCLYQSTIATYKNNPMFLSHRGIELFDGSNMNLLSLPVDNFIRNLQQLKISQYLLSQTSANDWGHGSGTNIDTTTYSGSVAMVAPSSSGTSVEISSITTTGYNAARWMYGTNEYEAQRFYVNSPTTIDSFTCNLTTSSGSPSTIKIGIASNSGVFLSYVTSSVVTGINRYYIIPENLIVGTTYSIRLEYSSGGYIGVYMRSPNVYPYGVRFGEDDPIGTSDIGFSDFRIYGYLLIPSSASFTSSTMTATNWGGWGNFNVNDTKPSGSAITYGVKTSTANNNFSTRPFLPVTNGGTINSSVGPYIQVISSFSRTDATAIPMMNDFNITYYATTSNDPQAIVYRDGYWLACSTDTTTSINNVVLHFDRYGRFTLHNDIYMGSACLFNQDLMTGSSDTSGQIYRHDIAGLYSDAGRAYNSYITTKVFDVGLPANMKAFDYIYFHTHNDGAWNLYSRFRLDGTSDDYTSLDNISLSGSKIVVQKVKFPIDTNGFYTQLKFGNDNINESFSIRGLSLIYDIYPFQ